MRNPTTDAAADAAVVIAGMVEKLKAEYAPQAVMLFGSRADGSARPDSDIDLLVVVADSKKSGLDRAIEARWMLEDARRGFGVDVIVVTADELERRIGVGDHFYEDILYKGRPLHGARPNLKRCKPMGEGNPEYASEWIGNAERDWLLASILMRENAPEEGIGYHLQQSLEKFLKAYLISRGWRLERTHRLPELLAEAEAHDETLREYRKACADIATYYWWDRYPQRDPTPPEVSGRAAIRESFAHAEALVAKLRAGMAQAPPQPDANGGGATCEDSE